MNQSDNNFTPEKQAKEIIVITQAAPAFTSWLLFIFSLFSMTFTYLTYRQGKTNQAASSSMQPSKLNTQRQIELHDALDTYFNEQELRELCFDLGVDYEDLPFSGQGNKARELVALSARFNRLDKLQQEIKRKRPSLFSAVSATHPPATQRPAYPVA